ncbi:uncharacterized protein [Arachis hypogaea]|uniref:uncharacterized protein n=1 Tax=Arachis hypogaea TaxID=3818 RepID=UPI000787A129
MDHGDFRLSPKLARMHRRSLLNQRRIPPRGPTFERTIPADPNFIPLLPLKRSSATVEQSPSSSQAIDRLSNSGVMAKHFRASDSPVSALSIRGFRRTQSKTTSYSERNPLSNLTNVDHNQNVGFNPTVLTMNNSSGNYTGNDMKENASPGQDYSNISGISGGPSSATPARARHG